MTKEETIKVLQSIEDRAVDFPYMTACDWVAIAAAKRHLENSLEVKEVDLDEEVNVCLFSLDIDREERPETAEVIEIVAKHFFELGLKVQKGETELSKVKGFLVRDKDDYTAIYAEKPHRGKTEWVDGNDSCLMTINDARLVPDIEFEEEPVEVEVTLKRLKAKGE